MSSKGPKYTPPTAPRHHVRAPGFVSQETGLGDLISRATHAVGIRPCSGCARRAESLNQWMRFSPTGRQK